MSTKITKKNEEKQLIIDDSLVVRELNELRELSSSQKEQIYSLKKVVAGQKGGIATLQKENALLRANAEENIKHAREQVEAIRTALEAANQKLHDTVREQKELIQKLREDLFTIKTNYEYYMSLPWWKKIFIK